MVDKNSLSLRKKIKAKKPNFTRQESHKRIRLKGDGWRKPKGSKSKLRLRKAHKQIVVPGYGSPRDVKDMHPSGLNILWVETLSDIETIPVDTGIMIASTVGLRKKIALLKALITKKAIVLNVKDPQKFIDDAEKKIKASKEEKKKKKELKKSKDKKSEKKSKKKDESIEDKLSDEEKKKIEKKEIDKLLTQTKS